MKKAYGNANGIKNQPPDGMEELPIEILLKDYEKLTDDQMLKKYGIQLTSQVWKYFWEKEDGSKIDENKFDGTKIKSPSYFHD